MAESRGLTHDQIIVAVALGVEHGVNEKTIAEALASRGMEKREAKEVVRVISLAFQYAVLRSIYVPAGCQHDGEPLFEAAIAYAKARMHEPDCPRFLRRGPALANGAAWLLFFGGVIAATVFFGLYAPADTTLYVGFAAAGIALLLTPLMIYQLFALRVRKTRLAEVAKFADLLQDLLR
jgi:hypothetical protein